jgi:hypothetical protein
MMYRRATHIAIILLALPTYAIVYAFKGARTIWRGRFAFATSVQCPECREEISLVGTWRCRTDGFTYSGHALASCKICNSRPSFVRCLSCGVTKKIF